MISVFASPISFAFSNISFCNIPVYPVSWGSNSGLNDETSLWVSILTPGEVDRTINSDTETVQVLTVAAIPLILK